MKADKTKYMVMFRGVPYRTGTNVGVLGTGQSQVAGC